ncbi:twin-arginine translocase subunit TatC [Kribbella flavida]|uniref:twin-arginine translocase subunit TatC n=1 Tax=Kribbella flavida TaxID=182640 RepID=UPI00059C18CF|nr:twin-arginine translocase subunit TatC [Kribbella flavida]
MRIGRRKERRPEDDEGRMTLREHIAELRNRLLIAVLAIVLMSVVGYIFYDQALDFLKRPFDAGVKDLIASKNGGKEPELTFNSVTSPFTFQIKISLVFGLMLASPIWLYELWAFIAPGLHRSERRWAVLFAAIATPLFAAGLAVAYWTLPKGIEILIGFTPDFAQNLITLPEYLDFVLRTMLVFGIAFLLPLVVVLLNIVGLVPAAALAKFRPYIVLGIFVFGAVATPSGDPFSLMFLALPMCALFFAAEVIARIIDKRRARKTEELLAE